MTPTTTVLAWHGDQALRDRIVARMHQHRAADAIVRMIYQRIDPTKALGYRGCAIGCLLDVQPAVASRDCDGDCCAGETAEPDDGWHKETERQFGIPVAVALGIDWAFEDFALGIEAADFAVAVAEAIPVGADLTDVGRWVRDESCDEFGAREVPELLERLRSAPVPARADR